MANDPTAAPAKREPAAAATSAHVEGSVKETIESILVAFILAFIFRAFVVEAFVIPTGSMGPTLMGAHVRLECPDCGYRFTSNFATRETSGGDDTDIPPYFTFGRDTAYVCPNCGGRIPFAGPQKVYFGDRILVLKYRYLFTQPNPWDVVVFKSPFEKKRDPDDPKYVDNYIKRLVGLPGQSVMILDGDVYIGGHGARPGDFHILRKPAYAQSALWRDVFDNDYLPHGKRDVAAGAPWEEPWVVDGGTGWQGPHGAGAPNRVFTFDNAAGESAIRFDPVANHPNIDVLTDWLAYDENGPNGIGAPVCDLKLSCVYERTSGQGPLRLQLTKRADCFTAEFTAGKVTLSRNAVENGRTFAVGAPVWKAPLEAAVPELAVSGKPALVELINVDYRVTVRVNGRDVIATTDAEYTPNPAGLFDEAVRLRRGGYSAMELARPVVRIVAADQACSLKHLRLSKDGYYLNNGYHLDPNGGSTTQPWFASPENVMELGPDEYFVLGDNSPVSLDARFWGAPVDLPREGDYHAGPGRVPGRFLLGKAFYVYWPAGYRPNSIPYGIEPDFGDMRFIR